MRPARNGKPLVHRKPRMGQHLGVEAPPEEIELPDVGATLRRHRPEHLAVVHAAIEESRNHLRPWMPWADQSRADTETFLHRAVDDWEQGRNFGWMIVDTTEGSDGAVLGGTGLHDRLGPEALEIGYWRRADAGARGLVTASSRALTAAALALPGIERVEIHCDEANTASAAVPRRLGYRLDRIEDKPITAPGEHGRSMIWVHQP